MRTSIANVSLSATPVVFNLLIAVALTNLIGSAEYGRFVFALAIAATLSVLGTLGLGPLVARQVTRYRVEGLSPLVRGIIRRAQQAVSVASVLLVFLAAIAAYALEGSDASVVQAVWIGLALVPLTALVIIRQTTFIGFDRVVLARVPEAVVVPVLFLLLVLASAAIGNLSGRVAVALYVAAVATAFAFGLFLSHRVIPADVRRVEPAYDTPAWVKSARPLLLFAVINSFTDQIGVIFLGLFKGPATAGVFSVAYRGALFVSFLLVAATYPLAEVFARLWATGARDRLQRVITQSARVIFGGSLVLTLGLVVFGRQILEVFGPGYVSGRAALTILCVGQLVNAGTGNASLALVMTGHESDVTYSAAAGAFVSVALTVFLVPVFGLVGAASAAASGVIVYNVLLVTLLRKRTGLWAAAIPLRRAKPTDVAPE